MPSDRWSALLSGASLPPRLPDFTKSQAPALIPPETSSSAPECLADSRLQPFRELGEINNHSLVGAGSDFLDPIRRSDPELDASSATW
jgi:hypothetical protein